MMIEVPHTRHRYLKPLLIKALSFKGLVGVFGHRQVGKTTLIELLSKQYVTLDKQRENTHAHENPEAFIEELGRHKNRLPAAIDECQLAPPLFPALKEYVRTHKAPGIFLLSGSVRFSSRKAIREALTGRILTCELLPFSVSEIRQLPLNSLALDLLTANFRNFSFKGRAAQGLSKNGDAQKYLKFGGLPGIAFVRDARARNDLIESQLDLILDRDLRLVCETKLPLSRLRILAQLLAETQNRPLNLSELSRKSRISTPTLRKVLSGFESIFFIRPLRSEGDESRPVYFMEDQGEAHYLAAGRYDAMEDMDRLAFSHLRIPFAYQPGLSYESFQYRKQGGAYVPFVFRSGHRTIGFLCTLEAKPPLGAIRSADSFRKAFPGAKVIYLHPGKHLEILSSDEAFLPIEYFL